MDDSTRSIYIEKLKDVSLLKALDPASFAAVVEESEVRKFKRGQYVFQSEQPADEFYVILSGSIKIFKNTVDGREQILYVYRRGDFVGGLNLLMADNYFYMAQTLEDSEILVINQTSFDRYMYNNAAVLRVILQHSFYRIRYAEDLISRLGKNTASLKVAALLLRLKDDSGVKTADGSLIRLNMNREELGSYAGLTRESMTRTLNDFRESGFVSWTDPHTILIQDEKALLKLLES